ncbi:MAG: enoyl-CoA hydratase [Geminicoccaceae bacterium]
MSRTIVLERQDRVAIVRLDRPEALNALNSELMTELIDTMTPLDRDPSIGCFVITGSRKAFAAGADISEMAPKSFNQMFEDDFFAGWDAFTALRTPKIAAVSGYALGGGCELAMMCDMIFAADHAKFGQPEIKLGVIPGIGGSQRLTKLVGKAIAMDMILTGRMMDSEEALRAGLVSRVIPADELEAEAQKAAEIIAGYSKPAVMMAKEVVYRAEESGLTEGIRFERRVFHSIFATRDQKEGMQAFLDKRAPRFTGE